MEDEPELVVANIHGYRSWRVENGKNGPVLMSLFAGQKAPWLPGETKVALCDTEYTVPGTYFFGSIARFNEPGKHDAPGAHCMCGMWAYNEPDDPAANYLDHDYGIVKLAGVVRASGVVEVHENGFRAQRLDIVAVSPTRAQQSVVIGFGCDCDVCQTAADRRRTANLASEVEALKLVAERYGVPSFGSFADMAKAFPPTQKNEPKPKSQEMFTFTTPGGYLAGGFHFLSPSQWLASYGLPVTPSAFVNVSSTTISTPPQPTLQQQLAYNGTAKYDPDDDTKAKLELTATVPVTSRKSIAELFGIDPALLGVNDQEPEEETASWQNSVNQFDVSKSSPFPRPPKRPSRNPLRRLSRNLFRRSH